MNRSCEKMVKFNADGLQLELDEIDIAGVIDNSFVYPSCQTLKNWELKEVPEKLTFTYKCDTNNCEFPLAALRQSVELKASGVRDTADIIMTTINSRPDLFTSRECGGYIFQTAEKTVVVIKNDSVPATDDTRFGFIQLAEVRRRLIHQNELSKLRHAQEARKAPSNYCVPLGTAAVGAVGAVVGAALVVLKKAK